MPHITLEYSDNITIQSKQLRICFADIHDALSIVTEVSNCKSRAYACKQYHLGAGGPEQAFIALRVAMLAHPDRTAELKQKLAGTLQQLLLQHFEPLWQQHKLDCRPTVEIVDLQVYAK